MALVPFAKKKLIPAGSNDPAIIPIGVILHVDAGNNYDLYDFFRYRSGGIESHFHIAKDGTLFQYRSTEREADANYKANSFYSGGKRYGYISVETQGHERGEWTPAQIKTIKRLLQWAHKRHNIPLTVARTPTSRGIGYHTIHGAPSAWTPVAKSCPGPDRKRQFHNELVPWMAQGGGSVAPSTPAPQPKEDEVSWNEDLSKWEPGDKNPKDTMSAGQQLNQARGFAKSANRNSRKALNQARAANQNAKAAHNAIKALAKGFGPEIEAAVTEALKDAVIEVDVNVNTGEEDEA